mgnify:CR=1 FL=1
MLLSTQYVARVLFLPSQNNFLWHQVKLWEYLILKMWNYIWYDIFFLDFWHSKYQRDLKVHIRNGFV